MSEISKMNPEVREQWIKDLRSGEYTKIRGQLVQIDEEGEVVGHCALGVLCEQAVKAGVVVRFDHMESYGTVGKDEIRGATLPAAVAAWAGLESDGVWVEGKGEIPMLNDVVRPGLSNADGSYTFDDIAGFIEADAKGEEVAA